MIIPSNKKIEFSIPDEKIKEALNTFHIAGASVAIIQGTHVHTKAFGLAELPSTPATTNTLFYIGSITKSFLATTTTKFIASRANQTSKRKLALNTPIKDIVGEDFVLPDPWATKHLTLEDVLSHRTGSARHDVAYGGPIDTPKAVTRNLRHLPLNAEPRTRFEYCNSMYIVATHALETAAGQPFSDLLRTYITGPLFMNDTHASRSEALRHGHDTTRLYRGYGWEGDWESNAGRHTEHVYGSDDGLIGAAGCIISNIHDMVAYVKALLGNGLVLGRAIRDEVTKPRVVMAKNDFNDSYAHYALGLWRFFYRGVEIVQHTGDVVGYSSLMAFIPSRSWGFVFLGNGDWGSCAAASVLFHLLDEMLETPAEERYDPTEGNLNYIRSFTRKDPDIARKLFPGITNPPLPSTLPMEGYTGRFFNAGYREIVIHVAQSRGSGQKYLESKMDQRGNVVVLQLFHVSGEYWAGYKLRGEVEVLGQGVQEIRAMSKIGVDGRVSSWGISVETDLTRDDWRDTLIWFERA